MNFATNYNDVLTRKPKSLRDVARDFALDSLYALDKIKGGFKELEKPRVQMLYFHHIFKDEEKKFDNLLQKLSKNHVFISHSEAVERILNNEIDKPYISFSSDDGFKNNLKAAEILNNYNASCCFFINTDLIGETNFDLINRHCNDKLDFPATEMLTWNEVEQLQKWNHEIGSHTLNHINIANSSQQEIEDDLNKTYQVIIEKCGSAKHFAYPYGRFFHFNDQARKAVFKAGFISCATAERGCHINSNTIHDYTQLALRRDQLIAHWKWQHMYYFLINSSKNANSSNNYFPY